MKTKNELEQAIVMHEEALEASRLSVEVEKTDLAQARRELADVNKPVLSAEMFDEIHEAVERAVEVPVTPLARAPDIFRSAVFRLPL